jgi:[methyl-Co(III) methanol-specific corrinoid protein]:coenzyme M methyltransferase
MKACGYERPLADTDPVAMTELGYAGHVYAGFEWVKAMGWDITALSEALGCPLGAPASDRQYYIQAHPFSERPEELAFPQDFLNRGRFPSYRENLRLLKERVRETLAIYGETEGAFTCAANLVGLSQLIKWCFKKPAHVAHVLSVTSQAAVAAANFAFDHGADYYVFAEPSSGPALLSPTLYEKFVLPVQSEIIRRVKGPVVLHVCGNTNPIIELMCETGAAGISIEEKSDLRRTVAIAHEKNVRVFGNVGTATVMSNGSPEDVYRASVAALESGTDFLCPGCGIAPKTPLQNILQLKKARDDHNR